MKQTTVRSHPAKVDLNGLKNAIRGAKDKLAAVRNIRHAIYPSQIRPFVEWLHLDPISRSRIFAKANPKSAQDLEARRPLPSITLGNEIRWIAAWLHIHATELSAFVSAKDVFEHHVLSGQYAVAGNILDGIQQEFGLSLWLIKHRIALLSSTSGLEKQKEYAAAIRSTAVPNGVAQFVTHYLSVRVEEGVTRNRLSEQLKSALLAADLSPQELGPYIRYSILDGSLEEPEEADGALRMAASVSAIDSFECLTHIARTFLNSDNDLDTAILAAASLLAPVLDRRLIVIRTLLKEDVYIPSPGDFDLAVHLERYLADAEEPPIPSSAPTTPGAIDLARRSTFVPSELPPQGLADTILSHALRYERRDNESVGALAALEKLGTTWSGLETGQWLLALADLEQGRHQLAQGLARASPSINLLALEYLDLGKDSYQAWFKVQLKPAAATYLSLVGGSLPYDFNLPPSAPFYLAFAGTLAKAGRWSDCIDVCSLARMLHLPPFAHNRSTLILAGALVQSSRLAEALELVVTSFFAAPDLLRLLPLDDLARRIGKRMGALADSLALPIFFDFYSKLAPEHGRDPRRRFAYEDFLTAHGASRPSQLFASAMAFDRLRLVYFLKNVCVESVMETSLAFVSSKEVAEERVEVCKLLIQLDPASRETYENEVMTIVRQLALQRRVQTIEQSKIYVDLDGIRAKASRNLTSSFTQFNGLRAAGAARIASALRAALADAAAKRTAQGIVVLRLPDNEAFEVLRRMVEELRDDFVASNEYGLNWYLSTRIRHGVLAPRLRSPLQAAKLVTQRDTLTGTYRSNDYWIAQSGATGESALSLSSLLSSFTQGIDATINDIVDRWIHIRRPQNPDAMFVFDVNDDDVAKIERDLRDASTVEDLTERTFEMLNEQLDQNLAEVRQRLEIEAKAKFNELLNSLSASLADLALPDPSRLLNAVIAAHTEVLTTLMLVSNWFRRTKAISNEPFTTEEAVRSALEVSKLLGRPLDYKITATPDAATLLPGTKFYGVADVFLNLFKNVSEHSEALGIPEVTIDIVQNSQTSGLAVRIENRVNPSVFTSGAPARVDRIRAELQAGAELHRESGEGGTGFLKVSRILRREFRGRSVPNFYFTASTFVVELELPLEP